MTDLDGFEAALSGHETRMLSTVDWRRIGRRARALAHRPYWSFAWLAALGVANIVIGVTGFGEGYNTGAGIGLLMIAYGRLGALRETKERIAGMGDEPRELLAGYVKDLRSASAGQFVKSLMCFFLAVVFGLCALFGKYPAAAGIVALILVGLTVWHFWRFYRLGVEASEAEALDAGA